jgi:hypothetical protein
MKKLRPTHGRGHDTETVGKPPLQPEKLRERQAGMEERLCQVFKQVADDG